MNRLQETILGIMIKIHDLCVKENIEYYLCYGSLLGAVRHRGFIPWDDDMDIVMTRENYNKFISLADRLPDNLGLLTYETSDKYMYNFAKVEDKTTSFIENITLKSKVISGVYVDVFPLDKVPNDNLEINKLWMKQRRLQNLIYSHYTKDFSGGNIVTRLVKKFLSIVSVKFLHRKLDHMIMKYDKTSCNHYFMFTNGFEYLVFEKADLKPVEYEFGGGGNKFVSFENYDKILKAIYGDYMKLPNEEDRSSHVPFYTNLERRISPAELEELIREKSL